jgi:DNA-binding MarR family transcriptional regulator
MNAKPNERLNEDANEPLNEGAIIILRLLWRYGELSVSAISGLLALYESRVKELCDELLRREMISWKPVAKRDNRSPMQLEQKGRAYVMEERHI